MVLSFKLMIALLHDCPVMINLVIVDMPKDPIAPIILGRPFLRTIKATINVFEGNVRFDLPAKDPFVRHFPRKKKMKKYTGDGISSSMLEATGLVYLYPSDHHYGRAIRPKTSALWEATHANKVEE